MKLSLSSCSIRRWPWLLAIALLTTVGCNRRAAQPKSDAAQITEDIRALKVERDKYDDKLKEMQRKLEASRTVSLVATTWHAEQKSFKRQVEQPGYILAEETTPIYAFYPAYVQEIADYKVKLPSGKVAARPIDMGDVVDKGALLARLKVPEREDEVKLKKALVLQMRAEFKQAQEVLETAIANIDIAKSVIAEEESLRPRIQSKYKRWDSEFTRLTGLKGVIDEQILEETRNQRDGARGELGEVEAKVRRAMASYGESIARRSKAEADVKLAEQRIDVALAQEKMAQSLLDYRDVVAPFKGVLTLRNVHTGHFVKPAQGGEKAEPLFVIVKMDLMRIFIDVPELDARYVQPGDKARVRIQALDNREFPGIVARTSWSLDATSRTLRVEVDLPNPTHELRPGMYAYGYIPIQYRDVWTLPDSAIIQKEEEGTFVFRVGDSKLGDRAEDDGKAILTLVRLGIKDGSAYQVLKYQRKSADPAVAASWHDFSDKQRIIMNPSGFADGMKIEKMVSLK